MAKQQKLPEKIRKITAKIASDYKPEKIILFGSAAWGNFGEDSDLDLLIIKKGVDVLSRGERYREVSKVLDHEVALDILIYTPYEVKKRLYLGDPFIEQILREGKTLYGS